MILHNYDLYEDCYRVRLLASLTGQTLTVVNVDAFPGKEEQTAPYLALNPLGRLPILEDGDLVLTSLSGILWHVAAADPLKRFISDDPREMARIVDWLGFACTDLACAAQARAVSVLDVQGDRDALIATSRAMLRIMDDHMTQQAVLGEAYFAGHQPSLADVALFPAFALSRDFNVDHDEYPALRLWARRVRALKGFIAMPGIPDYH